MLRLIQRTLTHSGPGMWGNANVTTCSDTQHALALGSDDLPFTRDDRKIATTTGDPAL